MASCSSSSSSSARLLATSTRCLCTAAPSRTLRPTFPLQSQRLPPHRAFGTGPYVALEASSDGRAAQPRWRSTPRGMSMPFRIRPRTLKAEWKCNDDPRRLAAFYTRLLGPGGDILLTEETRWLAVTHKSFDQGRRGFNDRLSYLGKRIADLQTSLALVEMPTDPLRPQGADAYQRHAFSHPSLDGLSNLSASAKSAVLSKSRLAGLAKTYGLEDVLRWVPRNPENLAGSGHEVVMAQALYAIVGALALERGGELANRVVREKMLRPLGVVMPEVL